MYQLVFYVPRSHLQEVKRACFDAGGGRYDNYDSCCWQVLGQGQFRPQEKSKPFVGVVNKIELVDEFRVEMIIDKGRVNAVVESLLKAHPYEEVAYHLVEVLTKERFKSNGDKDVKS